MNNTQAARILLLMFALIASSFAQTASKSFSRVEGASWLVHLQRPLQNTSMGNTGRLGPGPENAPEPVVLPAGLINGIASDHVSLHPDDLYRLNCRACHGELGQGAPPEINSVINPVRATSARLVMERMKSMGLDMKASDATQMAKQSKDALLKRLHEGGESMPAFSQLNDAEVNVLLAYLNQLAGVTATTPAMTVKEPAMRVGELIVRSTCHICHGADGSNPTPEEMLNGAIPPLSSLTSRVSHAEFIRKVTRGAPVKMGPIPTLYRGRMPVFYYLTPQEAEYVYQYLSQTQVQSADVARVAALTGPADDNDPGAPAYTRPATGDPASGILAGPLSAIAILAFMLFAAGVWFTVRELRRLSLSPQESAPSRARPVRVDALSPNKELESAG